jgi:hypothetical protein
MSSFLQRYQGGEHVAVWKELVALGKGVRHKLYYDDAVAVANETMRRARHNVELLIQRLAGMGYCFVPPSDAYLLNSLSITSPRMAASNARDERRAKMKEELETKVNGFRNIPPLQNPDVFEPPSKSTEADIRKLEREAGGPMPISLRAWYAQVGGVSLVGSHDVINPEDAPIASDPLVVSRPSDLVQMLDFGESEDGLGLWIAPDDLHKANVSGGEPYTITIPNECADAPFEYEWHETTFVNYLRKTFEWGGFPGWERDKKAPLETIAKLKEGFLPI